MIHDNDNEWGNLGNEEHFNWSYQKLAAAHTKHCKGKDWKQNAGQKAALKKRKKLYKTAEYLEAHTARNKALAKDPEWLAKTQVQLDKNNTDPEILARRRESAKKTRRAVTGPMGNFVSVGEFSKTTGMCWGDKLRLLPHLYYYTEDGPGKTITEKVYYTPKGAFPSMKHAMDADDNPGHYPGLKFKPHIKWFKARQKEQPDAYYVVVEAKRDWLYETGKPAK